MFSHYFQAVGECGHLRNITWTSGKKRKLKYVRDYCPFCSMGKEEFVRVRFNIKKYLDEVEEES